MSGFGVFLQKEAMEVFRTWRIWVLPLILLFVGVTSPMLAEITPALLDSVAGDQPGLVIEIPDPTTVDAFLQFSKNNMQIVLIAVIIAVAGMIAAEKRSGTAILVLTKPLSREAMLIAKVVSNWLLLAFATGVGWLSCLGFTAVFFDLKMVGEFASATGIWFALAAFFVTLMALLSVLLGSQSGAAGAGLGIYLVLYILSGWGPARDYTVAGLFTAGDRLLLGQEVALGWPLATTAGAALVLVVLAALAFRRQEL